MHLHWARGLTGSGLPRWLAVGGLGLVLSCSSPPAELGCPLPSADAPDRFQACLHGSGVFGRWVVDDQGLPAYAYDFDAADPRGQWELSDGSVRTDHLFQLGNDRVIGVADSRGFVQLFARDRGPVFLNRVDLAQGRPGGGFSYVAEYATAWATAPHLAPAGAWTSRRFGIGYARYETRYDGLSVVHHIAAPPGDRSYLVDEVTITNLAAGPRRLRHYEVWDVNWHPLVLQLVRSGELAANIPANGDTQRDEEARLYDQWATLDYSDNAARIGFEYVASEPLPADAPADRDHHPDVVFLARLLPTAAEADLAVHTDREAFWGDGDLALPEAVATAAPPTAPLARRSGAGNPAVLVDELALHLAPGERRVLRYAFGTVPPGQGIEALTSLRDPTWDLAADLAGHWRERLPYVLAPEAPVLHREMAWHGAQLQAASVYDAYLEARTIVQGSVYLYGHGLDGAARDFALFSVPTSYLRPSLSRDLLRTIMRLTYADTHQISYAVQGFGMPETAGIHRAPSDMDLFFLWGLVEYLAATGDQGFLADLSHFWPRDAGPAVSTLEHARAALVHLMDEVGLGPNGLIRVRTGDWSDGIVFEAENRELAEEVGESVPNTQMAAWVLPRAAALFDDEDPGFAAEVRDWAAARREAAQGQWVERWYRRAWFGPTDPYGEGHLNLEAQVWALIAELPDETRRDTLLDEIWKQLDEPSAVGARRVPGGMVWHAITGLLTWGYARHDPQLAWGSLTRHTMAAYAAHNPAQWYGIWSGPDALGVDGGTWGSVVTPMMDWPVMNANQHALPLIGLVRVAGIEPAPDGNGLRIDPAPAPTPVTLDLPLLRLTYDARSVRGVYRPVVTGSNVLQLCVPEGATQATVNGEDVPLLPAEPFVRVRMDFVAGDEIPFEVQ